MKTTEDIKITLSEREAQSLQVALKFYLDVVHTNIADVRNNSSLYSWLVGQLMKESQ